MGLLRYLIFVLFPFSFGFPNRNSEGNSEFVPSEFSVSYTSKPIVDFGCAENEHFSFCTAQCQHNCSNLGIPIPCPIGCFPGCVCDEGYVRGPNNDCVLVEECDATENRVHFDVDALTSSSQCAENEKYSSCNAHCQSNCTTITNPVHCSAECVSGCVCDEDYVRDSNGDCIPVEKCMELLFEELSEDSLPRSCRSNEHFSKCNGLPLCQKSCSNYKEHIICPLLCVPGCICDEGYVIGPSGECIPLEQCPFEMKSSSIQEEDFCPPNEVFSACYAHCQRNCTNWSDPSMICSKICVPGCICVNGMVRGPYGNCIQPRKCLTSHNLQSVQGNIAVDCPVDEHFDSCNAHCQKNCSNWEKEIECTKICIPGCVCDDGFVRGPYGKCVLTEKCSSLNQKNIKRKSQTSCPDGEERSNLQSFQGSNLYCISDNDVMEFCPPTYLNGCVCKKGLIRGHDNRCIDHRLLPIANEILFIHDLINPELSRNNLELEIIEESFDFIETPEDSTFASTTLQSAFPSVKINSQEIANVEITTTTPQETSHENLNVEDLQLCESDQECLEWCQEQGFSIGVCRGYAKWSYCACRHG